MAEKKTKVGELIKKAIEKKVKEKTDGEDEMLSLTLLKITIDEDCNLNFTVPFECLDIMFSD